MIKFLFPGVSAALPIFNACAMPKNKSMYKESGNYRRNVLAFAFSFPRL
jgi:hypothetical protein